MSPVVLRFNKKEGSSRYTIIVSKKIDKRATKRNRMRRIIRESLRRLYPTGADITCIVKKNIADFSQKETEELIKKLYETNSA